MKAHQLSFGLALAFMLFSCDKAGTCTLGREASCPPGAFCHAGEGAKAGTRGICVERRVVAPPKPTVKAWKLWLPAQGEEITPLREGNKGDNPHAGWVGPGEARAQAQVTGLGPGEALEASAGPEGVPAACTPEGEEGEGWTCVFEAGWALAEPEADTVEVKLKLGESAQHTLVYRVDLQAPQLEVQANVLLPSTVQVCARAQDVQSGVMRVQAGTPRAILRDSVLELTWKEETEKQEEGSLLSCHSTSLSSLADVDLSAVRFDMHAQAWDKAGNHAAARVQGSIARLHCSAQMEGLWEDAVTQPLVVSHGRIVFGTSLGLGATQPNNSLYFFNPALCELSTRVHVGAVRGPMVAFDETSIGIALGGGGPEGRDTPRLSWVNARGFIHPYANVDCIQGHNGTHADATFDKGLSLLIPPWPFISNYLVAPANSMLAQESHLVAYRPEVYWWAGCSSSEEVPGLFRTSTAQHTSGTVVGAYGLWQVGEWHYDAENYTWSAETPSGHSTDNPASLAIADGGVQVSSGYLAIDSRDKGYAVRRVLLSNLYEVLPMVPGTNLPPRIVEVPSAGSPLLGEPLGDSPAEAYFVLTDGTVLAFVADTMELLWTLALGFRISPEAQPVLTGNTLWVVGTQGQVRGIRVGSKGLNRQAPWPKAFRDNCNTSSRLSTPERLPHCF